MTTPLSSLQDKVDELRESSDADSNWKCFRLQGLGHVCNVKSGKPAG